MEMIQPFMEHKAAQLDPAWAWSQEVEKFKKAPASNKTVASTKKFREFMQNFVSQSKDDELKRVYSEKSMWTEVQEEAAKAVDEYNRQGHSWRHPFRTAGRAFTDTASAAEFLIELLPNGDYASVLCGALRLVYNAATRMKLIREHILKCLASISRTIDNTTSYIRLYIQDAELRQKVEDLYIAILEAVEGMTAWLKHSSAGAFKAFFQQSKYGKVLEDKITTNIQDKIEAFHDQVRICLHSKVANIDAVAIQTFKGVQKGSSTLETMLLGLAKDREWHFRRYDQMERRMEEKLTRLSQNASSPSHVFITQVNQPGITAQQLLQIMGANLQGPLSDAALGGQQQLDSVALDNEQAFTFGKAMSPIRQARTASLMHDPDFRYWFKAARSQTLVVNGMENDAAHHTISPLTYLCVLLSQTLSHLRIADPLTFFCGQHSTPGDPLEGADGMMRSLISQLLILYGDRLGLGFVDFLTFQKIKSYDVDALCLLFENLLQGIGQGIVFCMIDGISWYETEARSGKMRVVMPFLQSLVEAVKKSQSGVIFKLLVTSPIMSQHSREWFPREAELLMQGDIEGDGHAFGESHMTAQSQEIFNME